MSDTVHGGMVVFGEATRLRLDVDAVRAARPYLLYSGLHLVRRATTRGTWATLLLLESLQCLKPLVTCWQSFPSRPAQQESPPHVTGWARGHRAWGSAAVAPIRGLRHRVAAAGVGGAAAEHRRRAQAWRAGGACRAWHCGAGAYLARRGGARWHRTCLER